VHAILRGEAARGDAELLQRVRKRQRKIDVLLRVAVHRPVEGVTDAGREPTGHRDVHAARRAPAAHRGCLDRRARQDEQVGDLTSLERELDDALVLDDRADAGAADVDKRRGGFNRDRLLERAEFQGRIDRRRGAACSTSPVCRSS
jgi:hypothetical protein